MARPPAHSGAVVNRSDGQIALRDTVSVIDFDADPRGVIDSAPALRGAIAEAQSRLAIGYGITKGVRVYVPGGRYLLGSKIQVPDGIAIEGDGIWLTHFYIPAPFPDNAVFEPLAIDWSQQIYNLQGFALFGQSSAGVPTSNQQNGGLPTTVASAAPLQTGFNIVAVDDISGYAPNGTLSVGTQRVRYQSLNVATRTFQGCYIVSGWGFAMNAGDAINPITTNNVVGVVISGIGGPCTLRNLWLQYHSAECLLNMVSLNTVIENVNATNAGRDSILHEGARNNTHYRNILAQYPNAGDLAGTFAALHIRGQADSNNFQGYHKVDNLYTEISAHNGIGLWLESHGSVSVDTFNLQGGTNLGGTSIATQVGIQIDSSQGSPFVQDGSHAANIMLRNVGTSKVGRVTLKDNVRGYATPANVSVYGIALSDYTTERGDPIAAVTYGAAITPRNQGWQTITVTNATAFTIAAPPAPTAYASPEITIEIFNNSGGAMGVITWNAIFKFAGFVWANPATGLRRYARFRWNGASWVCAGLAAADY